VPDRKIKYKELQTFCKMKRLTAYVSGNVQKVGYRARVVQIANALGLKGMVENTLDGRVKIIAEGEEEKMRWFMEAINIKDALIQVTTVEKSFSQSSGEFSRFYKVVLQGETDSRLDRGVEVLKDILCAVKDMNTNLGGKMDNLGNKIDCLGGKIEIIGDKIDGLGGKMDRLGGKMKGMLEKQDDLINEVRDSRNDLDG
jgi:acylphosphatase